DTSSVVGISLRFSKDSNSEEDIICTSERAFERFSNLRFLQISGEDYEHAINPRSLNNISRKLRFLSWTGFGMPCLPSSFHPKLLVKLDMPFSELEKLWDEVRKLVSLPQLPYSLVQLYAENCESLERLDCSFPNLDIRRLDFANCCKLNQEARDLIIQTLTNGFAVLPGGEVPECFPYRSSGSSVTVKLNQMPLGTSTTFKACVVFEDNLNQAGGGGFIYYSNTPTQNALGEFGKYTEGPVLEKHLYIFEVEAVEVTSTELVFEFRFWSHMGGRREIKECGVFLTLGGYLFGYCNKQQNSQPTRINKEHQSINSLIYHRL
ncbi:unnamed protein product, partial [Thlaspi arvense]